MADELNKPSRGTGDWDIPLNQNFDTLEAAARAFLPRGTTQTLNVADVNPDRIKSAPYRIPAGGDIIFEPDVTTLFSNINEGEYVFVPSGEHDPVTINANAVTVQGASQEEVLFNNSTGDGITVNGNQAVIREVGVASQGGSGIVVNSFGNIIENVTFLSCDDNHVKFQGGSFSILNKAVLQSGSSNDSVLLDSGSTGNIVKNITNSRSITDNGSGNVIGDIT
jgi:predicted ribosome-associated RNA-binding protein Tma20